MSKSGYTLVEMLAAIAVVALTLSGLAQGGRVLSQNQGRAVSRGDEVMNNVRLVSAFTDSLSATTAVTGGPTKLAFGCGSDRSCAITLSSSSEMISDGVHETRLRPGNGDLRFVYVTPTSIHSAWPAPSNSPLIGVAILNGTTDMPVAYAPVFSTEPLDCEFDLLTRQCRGKAPG